MVNNIYLCMFAFFCVFLRFHTSPSTDNTYSIINNWKDGVHHVVCVWVTYEHNVWQSFPASCHHPVTLPRATVSTPRTILNARVCMIAGLHVYQHTGACESTAVAVRVQRRMKVFSDSFLWELEKWRLKKRRDVQMVSRTANKLRSLFDSSASAPLIMLK